MQPTCSSTSKKNPKIIKVRRLKHHFCKDIQVAKSHKKRCSISQIKTMMRYYFIPVRTVIIEKSTSKCWGGWGRQWNPTTLLVGMYTVRPLKRSGRRFPKKTKMPYNPEIPLLGRYSEKMKMNLKKLTHPTFTAALFTIAETWKRPKRPSTDEWIKNGTYTQWSISHKNNEITPPAATRVDPDTLRQAEKDKYHDITNTRTLKKWYKGTYLQNRLTDAGKRHDYQKGKEMGRDKLGVWD